jgi:hypothetical protein
MSQSPPRTTTVALMREALDLRHTASLSGCPATDHPHQRRTSTSCDPEMLRMFGNVGPSYAIEKWCFGNALRWLWRQSGGAGFGFHQTGTSLQRACCKTRGRQSLLQRSSRWEGSGEVASPDRYGRHSADGRQLLDRRCLRLVRGAGRACETGMNRIIPSIARLSRSGDDSISSCRAVAAPSLAIESTAPAGRSVPRGMVGCRGKSSPTAHPAPCRL